MSSEKIWFRGMDKEERIFHVLSDKDIKKVSTITNQEDDENPTTPQQHKMRSIHLSCLLCPLIYYISHRAFCSTILPLGYPMEIVLTSEVLCIWEVINC